MKVEFLRTKQIEEVRDLIHGFSHRYITDIKDFVTTTESCGFSSTESAEHLSRLLRKWQACRPSAVHKNLLPIITQLASDFETISNLNIRNIDNASPNEKEAIRRIWSLLISQICNNREIADVAASKAIHILTKGQLGPALDSNARKKLGLPRIRSSEEYLNILLAISDDIRTFERINNPVLLESLVPVEWLPVSVGRVYDMAIGPRENTKEHKTDNALNPPYLEDMKEMPSFSFDEAFRMLHLNGPARIISSRGTIYDVEAWRMRNGKLAIRAKLLPPSKGYIYIHSDCWGKDITCKNTRAGGIYNGRDNIYIWLKKHA